MNTLPASQNTFLKEFQEDSQIIGNQTVQFLRLVYPSYLVDKDHIDLLLEKDGLTQLNAMTFFRINVCTADNVDNVFANVNEKFEKLFTALHSISIPISYGIISRDGTTNLVLGVYSRTAAESVAAITRGMLSGIDMQEIRPNFSKSTNRMLSHGILAGIPSLYVKEQKQPFSLAPIMRSLNGQNYTLLFIAKPVSPAMISQNISELISIKDRAFAVSKRNIARSNSYSKNTTKTTSETESRNNMTGSAILGTIGTVAGASLGSILPGIGTAIGGALGASLGTLIGSCFNSSHSKGISESITTAITDGNTISGDIQNGFALELMNYADGAIERLKGGQNNGIWQTAIAYSAENEMAKNIIQACLKGELSKIDSEKLPMLAFEPRNSYEPLLFPKFLEDTRPNELCSYLNSAELGLLCTVPTENVPDFELRLEKKLPLIAGKSDEHEIQIGHVVDGKRPIKNMPFTLSEQDLNKHTFVCGITGSGKTTTVKKILVEAHKPFLVIESAKKEYRNIAVDTTIYTLGKPEINAPRINPFFIMPGVSPQTHIDYLKDLFNAAFSFYGPMSYILEKCLHSVYKNKGWDLTLGYHPLLANVKNPADFFSIDHLKKQYAKAAHKFLFPTMQELKEEIARYVDEELKYDGEVAGNIKTAMKVRLENLCIGAKGYTFNTNEFLNFDELMKQNVVFELEGLADDSDKAFSVGLLVIFINEYRQIQKEISGSQKMGLQHLLVIEEAHRLLKNIETERISETMGNPKGKAVEHFTNMIAEMRSYGQGVIVAEQIPTKLAPDVIKNSSNKIVQRIVSADDQQTIANTIGLSNEDALQLGFLETGFAYCHKEGMALPTPVKIQNYFISDGMLQDLDVFVTDEELYNNNTDRFDVINLCTICNTFDGDITIKRKTLAFLNTLLAENQNCGVEACDRLMHFIADEIDNKGIRLIFARTPARLHAQYLTEQILSLMVRGIYCVKNLPDDHFIHLLESVLYAPSIEKMTELKKQMRDLYETDLVRYAKVNVAALIHRSLTKDTKDTEDTDIPGTVREYFLVVSNDTIREITNTLKGGGLI